MFSDRGVIGVIGTRFGEGSVDVLQLWQRYAHLRLLLELPGKHGVSGERRGDAKHGSLWRIVIDIELSNQKRNSEETGQSSIV